MCSSGSHATVVKDQRAVDIEIKGKPVIIITSASANPNEENIRRFAIVNLDESEKQTEAILRRKAEIAKTGLRIEFNQDITSTLTYLDGYAVKVPYADLLLKHLPHGIVMRTHVDRLFDLIKASACLHQYQRELDSENYLIAQKQDYDIARVVIQKLTSNPKMVSLTKNQQRLLDIFEKLGNYNYSVSDIEPKVSFLSDRQLRRELDKLADLGFLEKDKENRAEPRQAVLVYSKREMDKIEIPEWKELIAES